MFYSRPAYSDSWQWSWSRHCGSCPRLALHIDPGSLRLWHFGTGCAGNPIRMGLVLWWWCRLAGAHDPYVPVGRPSSLSVRHRACGVWWRHKVELPASGWCGSSSNRQCRRRRAALSQWYWSSGGRVASRGWWRPGKDKKRIIKRGFSETYYLLFIVLLYAYFKYLLLKAFWVLLKGLMLLTSKYKERASTKWSKSMNDDTTKQVKINIQPNNCEVRS